MPALSFSKLALHYLKRLGNVLQPLSNNCSCCGLLSEVERTMTVITANLMPLREDYCPFWIKIP